MPTTASYYNTLITNLDASAKAKKDALDAAYDRATQSIVDKQTGAITYKQEGGKPMYGAEDVAYMEKQRLSKASAESAGMLRSGQSARALATNEAEYRTRLSELSAKLAAEKGQVEAETGTKKAEYEAMYGTPAAGKSTSNTPAGTTPQSSSVAAPPKPPAATSIPRSTYTSMTPAQQRSVASRATVPGGFGATAKPQPAPVSNTKVKNLTRALK